MTKQINSKANGSPNRGNIFTNIYKKVKRILDVQNMSANNAIHVQAICITFILKCVCVF